MLATNDHAQSVLTLPGTGGAILGVGTHLTMDTTEVRGNRAGQGGGLMVLGLAVDDLKLWMGGGGGGGTQQH